MKKLLNLFLILTVGLLVSCAGESVTIPTPEENTEEVPNGGDTAREEIKGVGSPVKEVTDNYTLEYQYKDDVLVLPESVHNYVSYTEGDSVLIFKKEFPLAYLPMTGDVLAAPASDYLPDGLGCRVVSITKEAVGYNVVTEPAPLDEIFSDLKLKATLTEQVGETNSRQNDFCTYDVINMEVSTAEDGKYMQSRLNAFLTYNLDIDIADRRIYFGVGLSGIYSGQMGVKAKKTAEVVWAEWKSKMGGKRMKKFKFGDLVVKTSCSGTLKSTITGEIDASIGSDIGFDLSYTFYNGLEDVSGSVNPLSDEGLINHLSWEGNGKTALELQLGLGISFFNARCVDIMEPSLILESKAKLDFDDMNLFKNGSNMGVEFMGKAKVKDYVAKVFGSKALEKNNKPELKVSFWKEEIPLLPQLKQIDNNVGVVPDEERFILNYAYNVDGGLLCKYMMIQPVIMAYNGDQLYKVFYNNGIVSWNENQRFSFNMDINIYDSDIDLRPGIDINGHCFSTNGVFINIPSPTIKVTGIRQTKAEQRGEDDYYIEFETLVNVTDPDRIKTSGLYSGCDLIQDAKVLFPKSGLYSIKGWYHGTRPTYTVALGGYLIRKGQDNEIKSPLVYKTVSCGASRSTVNEMPDTEDGQVYLDWSSIKLAE